MMHFTSDPVCPKCGGELFLEDKITVTGEDFREYRCRKCQHLVVEDHGAALWQLLHNANEERAELERLRAKRPWWKFWKK
jgi:tRNA(Ile2) C34 agmatinyltransferase TiaS